MSYGTISGGVLGLLWLVELARTAQRYLSVVFHLRRQAALYSVWGSLFTLGTRAEEHLYEQGYEEEEYF